MKDLNINQCWNLTPFPAGSSLWIPLSGRLTSYGESRYHSFPDYFCPHVIVSGKGIVEVNGVRHEMKRGDMFTLWPGSEILYHDFPETPWQFYYFHLCGNDQKAYVQSLGLTQKKPVNCAEKPKKVIECFDRIWRLMRKRAPGGQYRVLSRLFALPELCGHDAAPAPESDNLVEHTLTLINSSRNPAGTNVNELCEQLGISRVTLYRKFTAQLRQTPIDYIIKHRLDTACSLLLGTGKTVAEIAALSGFNSEKYFLKLFKQRFGQTPSEYRAKITVQAE